MFKRLSLLVFALLACSFFSYARHLPFEEGRYFYIESVHKGLVLDVQNASEEPGAQVILYERTGGANQQFKVTHFNGKYHQLIARHSGLALDVKDGNPDNTVPIIQYEATGGTNQLFKFVPAKNGCFYIVAKHSKKAFDAEYAHCASGSKVVQVEICDYNTTQLFRLVPVDETDDNHPEDNDDNYRNKSN